MQIVSLKIKNFLSITDVEIHAKKINQIVGKNNQGKTTVLKALDFVANGSTNPDLVQVGKDQAEVIIELDDNTVISRKLYQHGSQKLNIEKDGFKTPQPATFLKYLFDSSSFNPLDLLESKNRNAAILKALNLKISPESAAEKLDLTVDALPPVNFDKDGFEVLDELHKFYYTKRHELNKVAKESQQYYEMKKSDLEKTEFVQPKYNDEQLKKLQKKIENDIAKFAEAKGKYKNQLEQKKSYQGNLDLKTNQLKSIDEAIVKMQREILILKDRKILIENEIDIIQTQMPKIAEINLENEETEIKRKKEEFHKHAAMWQNFSQYQNMVNTVKELEFKATSDKDNADKIDNIVKKLHKDIKNEYMQESKLPIEGLEYGPDGFEINGTPIDHLSSSRSLKLAIEIARQLAGKSKLICIDGAELLDNETYKVLHKEIENDGFTYFITKVGDAFKNTDDQIIKMKNGATH